MTAIGRRAFCVLLLVLPAVIKAACVTTTHAAQYTVRDLITKTINEGIANGSFDRVLRKHLSTRRKKDIA